MTKQSVSHVLMGIEVSVWMRVTGLVGDKYPLIIPGTASIKTSLTWPLVLSESWLVLDFPKQLTSAISFFLSFVHSFVRSSVRPFFLSLFSLSRSVSLSAYVLSVALSLC